MEGCEIVRYPISRIVADPERFEDDELESAAALGVGAAYTKTTTGKELRAIKDTDRIELMARYYRPHHRRLKEAIDNELATTGSSLIIDAHSFPSDPLPFETGGERPDICIGADPYHTPDTLTAYLVERFQGFGYNVTVNEPYVGTMIPMDYYQTNEAVNSVMIEVKRALYMNETSLQRNRCSVMLKNQIRALLTAVPAAMPNN